MPGIDDDADMSGQSDGRYPVSSELETALERGLGPRERGLSHSALRLQPTVLQPPPDGLDAGGGNSSVSAEDDMDLGLDDDASAGRRQLLLAASGVAIALVGVAGWLIFGPVDEASLQPNAPQQTVPTVRAPPAIEAPAPAQPPAEAAALPVQPPQPAVQPEAPQAALPPTGSPTDAPLGSFSNDLVAPVTEGLSPPRKVNAVRIIVENDREVRPAP